jgi:hypothetical protein
MAIALFYLPYITTSANIINGVISIHTSDHISIHTSNHNSIHNSNDNSIPRLASHMFLTQKRRNEVLPMVPL